MSHETTAGMSLWDIPQVYQALLPLNVPSHDCDFCHCSIAAMTDEQADSDGPDVSVGCAVRGWFQCQTCTKEMCRRCACDHNHACTALRTHAQDETCAACRPMLGARACDGDLHRWTFCAFANDDEELMEDPYDSDNDRTLDTVGCPLLGWYTCDEKECSHLDFCGKCAAHHEHPCRARPVHATTTICGNCADTVAAQHCRWEMRPGRQAFIALCTRGGVGDAALAATQVTHDI